MMEEKFIHFFDLASMGLYRYIRTHDGNIYGGDIEIEDAAKKGKNFVVGAVAQGFLEALGFRVLVASSI